MSDKREDERAKSDPWAQWETKCDKPKPKKRKPDTIESLREALEFEKRCRGDLARRVERLENDYYHGGTSDDADNMGTD